MKSTEDQQESSNDKIEFIFLQKKISSSSRKRAYGIQSLEFSKSNHILVSASVLELSKSKFRLKYAKIEYIPEINFSINKKTCLENTLLVSTVVIFEHEYLSNYASSTIWRFDGLVGTSLLYQCTQIIQNVKILPHPFPGNYASNDFRIGAKYR